MVDDTLENGQVEEVEVKKNSKLKKAAGVGAGIVGVVAAGVGLSAMASGDNVEVAGKDTAAASHTLQPAGDVEVAQVSDDMSFSEAFASARKQVGAGGVFEWRGKLYGTYYKTEWDAMSQADKDQYAANVFGNPTHHTAEKPSDTLVQDNVTGNGSNQDGTTPNKPEVVEVKTGETGKEENTTIPQQDKITVENMDVQTVTDESGNPITVAYAKVNDYDSLFFDTDNDGNIDVMAVDVNKDGQITENEVVPIPKGELTVDDLVKSSSTDCVGQDGLLGQQTSSQLIEDSVIDNPLDDMASL